MGVPALFRWLSTKYPKIISAVKEEQPLEVDGETYPIDTTKPNPNGEEMHNLYLDMNGIVHPCSHPEDKPAPATEGEMMLEVFKYTDRVVNMVRPRKLLMIAVGTLTAPPTHNPKVGRSEHRFNCGWVSRITLSQFEHHFPRYQIVSLPAYQCDAYKYRWRCSESQDEPTARSTF